MGSQNNRPDESNKLLSPRVPKSDMTSGILTNVLHDENTLIALISPIGRHREWGAIRGYLKSIAGTFDIQTSSLEFLDRSGKLLETRDEAFGQEAAAKQVGPFSIHFSDDTRRPSDADVVRWRVNNLIVETNLSKEEGVDLSVTYLPLQVPVARDPHMIVTVINRTPQVINIADGIRSAICRSDGKAYQSSRGGHWDGGAGLNPGGATTRQFSLDDFPGVPRTGRHEMSIELLGLISEPKYVDWLPAADR
jgi:hypothetical protein